MKNINEMYEYLKEHIKSHSFEIVDNSIIAKRNYKSRSFASFKLTYLKKSNEISFKNTSFESHTLRFANEEYLISHLGCVASFK